MSVDERDEGRMLDEATAALRDTAVPEGPTPALKDATLSALKRPTHLDYESPTGGRKTIPWVLTAAAVVVAACGVSVYVYRRAQVLVSPAVVVTPAPAATRPAAPPGAVQPLDTDVRHAVRPADPGRVEVATGGPSITGTVRFAGQAPALQQIDMSAVKECAAQQHPGGAFDDSLVVNDGKLANVVVSVQFPDGLAPPAAPAPSPAMLDQKGCQYRPHVLAVRVGQPIVVSNSDGFLHNIHSLSFANPPFNFGQPTRDPGRNIGPLKAVEVFKVKCDVHPWMGAYVHVIDHAFFAVTKEDGAYTIPGGLPDGTYALMAWHEKLGEKRIAVAVKGGKADAVDFTFEAEP